jgi:glucose-6-phosphate 1-dehydrogenase
MAQIEAPANTNTRCDIVIFGATGDLAMRKLFPALYYLYCDGILDHDSRVIGVARSEIDTETFVERVDDALAKAVPDSELFPGNLARFGRLIEYRSVQAEGDIYDELAQLLPGQDRVRVIYLATSCELFASTCAGLRGAGLVSPHTRIVIEKPIGDDQRAARDIHEAIAEDIPEDQIFRIDHYLGKETVQNLMALRFGNVMFEPLWRAPFVEKVEITVAEDIGIEGRLDFYERTGALRDMVQSHMLQLMALVAMEIPGTFEPSAVREEKLKVLQALTPIRGVDVDRHVVKGQYAGFTEELGRASDTETFVALRAEVANWRWKGVPFYLRTGKSLPRRSSRIILQFRSVPQVIFQDQPVLQPNRLVLQLQPDDGIRLHLMAKQPGQGMSFQEVDLALDFHKVPGRRRQYAYERLIRDAVRGDSTLFLHRREVELGWQWVDPILEHWRREGSQPHIYARGSDGPEAAARLLDSPSGWDSDAAANAKAS